MWGVGNLVSARHWAAENSYDDVGKLPGNGVDVNEELGHTPDSPFCNEHETAIPGPVPSSLAETWEEVAVPAVCDGHQVTALVRFATGDDACIVQVSSGEDVRAAGEARDLFAALAAARRELEKQGLRLACNGARQDVWPSGMLRQAGYGRRAYVLTMPSAAASSTVDILEPAPEASVLATVDEQREWFHRYWDSVTRKGGS